MSWNANNDTYAQAAFKKLFGLAHTEVKGFPLGNEAIPTQLTIVASDVYTDSIPATAQSVTNVVFACTNATNGQSDSYLTVSQNTSIAPDGANEGHPYLITVPAGHGLIGKTNPLTGLQYASGDIVMSIIPKKFGLTWRPVLYDSTKTEIPPLSSQDWFMDERGLVVIRDNTIAPAYLKCWVYIGLTVATMGQSTGSSGFSGFSGYSGATAASGYSGYSGFSGSGISGFSGYSGSGISGISGFSGYSGTGTSGFSGYSGTVGTSGLSGYSGASGSADIAA
jgi:hypothetical protein